MTAPEREGIEWMLGECQANTDRLTPWERQFIESISDQYDRWGSLSLTLSSRS